MSGHRLDGIDDLAAGQVRRVVVDGLALCVARLDDGSVRAVHDACTHYRVRLSRGDLVGDAIECPAHGSLFDMVTGDVVGLPAYQALRTYPVQTVGATVVVDISAGPPIDHDPLRNDNAGDIGDADDIDDYDELDELEEESSA